MKRIAAILLILAFTTQLSAKLGILLYYQLNKKYITETFCVNKEKPQMHCNGSCHMQKQLKKQDEQPGKPVAPNLKDIHETFLFFENNFIGTFAKNPNYSIQTKYSFSMNTSVSEAVFHPPC